jgi:hypothetical protein
MERHGFRGSASNDMSYKYDLAAQVLTKIGIVLMNWMEQRHSLLRPIGEAHNERRRS